MEDITEEDKQILALMYLQEYVDYLKVKRPEAIVYWGTDGLTPKEFEKVFRAVPKEKLREMARIPFSDLEFKEWEEKQRFYCNKCNTYCLEEKKKVPITDPEWGEWQTDKDREFLKPNEYWCVYKQECLECGYVHYTSTGSEVIENR